MHNYFLTYEQGRKIYAYTSSKVYTLLNELEMKALLDTLVVNNIRDLKEVGEKSAEITFSNGSVLTIDDIRVFQVKDNKYDEQMSIIQKKIMEVLQKHTIEEYKSKLPNGYVPRVNRHRKNNFPKRAVAAITFVALLATMGYELHKVIKKDNIKDLPKEPEITYETSVVHSAPPIETYEEADLELPIETPEVISEQAVEEPVGNTIIELSFDSKSDSKYQKTVDYCGPIVDYYAKRYGLSTEVECAKLTQERPDNFENIGQITYDMFIGRKFHIPVYNENGFTGTYDDFTVTEEMLNTTEGNIMVSLAYTRFCTDKFSSYITGEFSYNQGENVLNNVCKHYGVNVENYKGDEHALEARNLINRFYQEKGRAHGDKNYLENVFRYLPMEDRGDATISYYLGNELKTIDLRNTNVYNMESERGLS